jgi:hypothetical protein
VLWRLGFMGLILLASASLVASTPSQAGPTDRQLWVVNYDGPKHKTDSPVDIAVSPNGGSVFVTGASYYGPGSFGLFQLRNDRLRGRDGNTDLVIALRQCWRFLRRPRRSRSESRWSVGLRDRHR